jgi:hypothetical protein
MDVSYEGATATAEQQDREEIVVIHQRFTGYSEFSHTKKIMETNEKTNR